MFIFLPVDSVKHLVFDLLSLLMILIFVEIIISNIIAFGAKLSPFHPVVKTVRGIVDPVVNPIRRLMPPPYKTYNLDFSPMIALILIQVVRNLMI
jgi:YggT family protein